ncbi:MAG: hypothetical protein IJO81_05640 [Clostridia bacterium]|nr:hypothetical protein [Clostridia bacterium]
MKKKGCSSYIIILIIAFVAAYWIAGFSEDSQIDFPDANDTSSLYPDDSSFSDGENGQNIQSGLTGKLGFTYYEQLSTDEKNIYNVFLEGVKNGDTSYKFNNVDCNTFEDSCFQAIRALTYDHPEYFWVACGYSYRANTSLFGNIGSAEVQLAQYSFWNYNMSKKQKIDELEAAVNNVAYLASQKGSDFEKIQFVHDYLIENAIYDHDGLNEYYKTYHDASCEYIFTAYGCLVNKKTVCSGYAKAFQLIMEKMGYDCLYVVGYAGESHAWNMVFIEGESYYVDITWDDADFDRGETPLYDYFGITTDSLEKTHTIGNEFSVPECNGNKYDYFNYTGRHLSVYDYYSAKSIIESQRYNDVIYIRFSSAYEFERAKQDLLTNQKIYTIEPFATGRSCRYVANDNHYILTMFPN